MMDTYQLSHILSRELLLARKVTHVRGSLYRGNFWGPAVGHLPWVTCGSLEIVRIVGHFSCGPF